MKRTALLKALGLAPIAAALAPLAARFAPAVAPVESMTNITPGCQLVIDTAGQLETLVVISVTATTFTAMPQGWKGCSAIHL